MNDEKKRNTLKLIGGTTVLAVGHISPVMTKAGGHSELRFSVRDNIVLGHVAVMDDKAKFTSRVPVYMVRPAGYQTQLINLVSVLQRRNSGELCKFSENLHTPFREIWTHIRVRPRHTVRPCT